MFMFTCLTILTSLAGACPACRFSTPTYLIVHAWFGVARHIPTCLMGNFISDFINRVCGDLGLLCLCHLIFSLTLEGSVASCNQSAKPYQERSFKPSCKSPLPSSIYIISDIVSIVKGFEVRFRAIFPLLETPRGTCRLYSGCKQGKQALS